MLGISNLWGNPKQLWRRVVIEYSSLKITKSSDKLPALGGLAKQMMARRGVEYLAGLWRDTLVYDMMWRLVRPQESPIKRVPSWSWTSVDGKVDYNNNLYSSQTTDMPQICCEILDSNVVLAGESLTGEVLSGYVRMRCFMLPVSLPYRGRLIAGEHGMFFDQDTMGISDSAEDLYIAKMVILWELHSLVVRPVNLADSVYKRVGLARFLDKGIENALPWPSDMKTITII